VSIDNIDFRDNDIGLDVKVNSAMDCASLCQKTNTCVAGVYAPSTKACWLKSKLDKVTYASDRTLLVAPATAQAPVRSWTQFTNMDHDHDDIACLTDGSRAEKCQALCNAHGSCSAYNEITYPASTALGTNGGCCIKNIKMPVTNVNGINFWTSS
jgi:hypothetical protein